VNKCLALLGALFRYAIGHEYIEANPAEGTKLRASSRRGHGEHPKHIQALMGLRPSTSRWTCTVTSCLGAGARSRIGSGRWFFAEVVVKR
jgi:hypothetical protein